MLRRLSLTLAGAFAQLSSLQANVVIDEIMYHPPSERPEEEYIELYNTGATFVDLSGWQITSGVEFTFPGGTSIPPGGFKVVAANSAAFQALYPTVSNFVAGWSGRLSNSANKITLKDSLGNTQDEVSYADDGDWAIGQKDVALDFGHRGWGWDSPADGGGKSLELINPSLDNSLGQYWLASTSVKGTPGAQNSVAALNVAPVILDVEHFPLVPTSTEPVTVTARISDDQSGITGVTLHYRNDGALSFASTAMFDDGIHGDGAAGDGVFGVLLPAQADGTIVEFYVRAVDNLTQSRTWPAPARDENGVAVQDANCLYQVDDSVYPGSMPIYRIVMRVADAQELTQINTDNPQIPNVDQTFSHARMNATWITRDGTGTNLKYRCGVRNRGNGSRSLQPQSFNIGFTNEDRWNNVTGLNLNTQDTPYQLLGSALYRKAGLAIAESRAVQLRVNGTNKTPGTGAPSYGFYVANETDDSTFCERHFPLDSSGNLYRGQRADGEGGANLRDQSTNSDPTLSDPLVYNGDVNAGGTGNYFKQTNASENNWADLIGLTQVLAKGHAAANYSVTYDADFLPKIQAAVDVTQWMRFFAVNIIADNSETNITSGDGDDYFLYFGKDDPRAKFVSYDLDTILGRSGSSNSTTHGIFRMCREVLSGNPPTPIHPFVAHPSLAPIYFQQLNEALDGAFSPGEFDPLVDQTLGGLVSSTVVQNIKTFNQQRTAFIRGLLPTSLSSITASTTAGTALTIQNGYPRSTATTCNLTGRADCERTVSVKVNGVAGTYTPWRVSATLPFTTRIGEWTASNVVLMPGLNRILVQAFDGANQEIERTYFTVWYDDTTVVSASGTIAANTTWTAAGGPYQVTAALTVNAGVTLTIQPGTTVYLASGVGITVAAGGRILAEGTETQPIRFSRAPTATGNGGTITINGQAGAPETHFYYVYFEYGGDPAVAAEANSNVVLDHCEWGRTDVSYIHLDGASFLVSNCIFPAATAGTYFEGFHGNGTPPAGGRAIVRDCFFGKCHSIASDYNDVLDFTGGNRTGTIIQFYNNVFVGSDDDLIDLDGTDAWIEGNLFMHVHRQGSPDSSSAISGGSDSGSTSEVTIIGNLFYDVDQAATAKQGNYYTFLQNTVVDQSGRGSLDTTTAVLNFSDEGFTEAAGMYAEGNIIHSAVALTRNYPGTALSGKVVFNNNLFPEGMTWSGPGTGNSNGNPLLADVQLTSPGVATGGAYNIPLPGPYDYQRVAAQIRAQFGLQSGSAAIGTGPNGSNKGGVRPLGVSLGGAPVGKTNLTTATITIGTLMSGSPIPSAAGTFPNGSGWTHYKWRQNGGAFSAETPITTPISLIALANGVQTIDVVGKNDAGLYQDAAVLGSDPRISSVSWTVDTAYVPPGPAPLVQINEVLAKNTETLGFNGNFPDVIELRNAGTAVADLSGWGLTDNTATPYKYAIPAGTLLAAGGRLVIYASGSNSVPQPKTGFGLKDQGDTLTLTRSLAAGGGVVDAVSFGFQLSDYSVGRRETDGGWDLCLPTFGSANIVAAQGPVSPVKINEWLADAVTLIGQDFIELYNAGPLPVNVGLSYLTDNPVDWKQRHQIRPLSFIGPAGYVFYKADADANQGPDHVNFKLSPDQGEIGLFSPSLELVDSIVYGPQSSDISEGRTPNGGSVITFFNQPTPGAPNPGSTGVTTTTVNLVPINHAWRYRSSSADFSATFFDPAFDDSTWSSGAQLLHIEPDTLASASGFAKTTALPVDTTNSNRPFQTTYFRTHFNYTGPLSGVTLRATVMADDGFIIYLNGHELLPISTGARVRMPTGTVTFSTIATANIGNASEETFEFDPTWVQPGDNVLAVEVHQEHSGTTQSSSDVVWGMKLDASVPAGTSQLVINEILPLNATLQNPDGSFHGWVELHNDGDTSLDISDMSLTNDVGVPRSYVFGLGTTIPGHGYVVLQCNGAAAASPTNTGFSLASAGGGVFLFRKLSEGGGLQDGVNYGLQVADFSLGRQPNGTGDFALSVPTRGALNQAAALGQITAVKLNEWVAGALPAGGWFELYNTATQPVPLGGHYLTDNLSDKVKYRIPALSFLSGSSGGRWRQLIADNNSLATPGHVNFQLSAGENIGFFSGNGLQLDAVTVGSVAAGSSQGRFPDGSSTIVTMPLTPGAPNAAAFVDTDGDGIPDSWESAYGLNPNDPADGGQDADGDGLSNRAEYTAGTDPRNGSSLFAAKVVKGPGAGQWTIQFTAVAGKTYTVRYKNLLTDPTWTKLSDVAAQQSTTVVNILDPNPSGLTARYYEVVTPQQ